jgi:hypothetical protein
MILVRHSISSQFTEAVKMKLKTYFTQDWELVYNEKVGNKVLFFNIPGKSNLEQLGDQYKVVYAPSIALPTPNFPADSRGNPAKTTL